MKNLNMVREYTGVYFWFETEIIMYRFVKLYKDLFMYYEYIEREDDVILYVRVRGGVIPEIKKGLKEEIICKGHNRYYIKAA